MNSILVGSRSVGTNSFEELFPKSQGHDSIVTEIFQYAFFQNSKNINSMSCIKTGIDGMKKEIPCHFF
jgi:hypothetical protein